MADWVSIAVNVILVIITLGTVVFASKSLYMEHGGQGSIEKETFRINNRDTEDIIYSWGVDFLNVGKRDILKVFLLAIIPIDGKKFKKKYILSKPLLLIKPDEQKSIRIELSSEEINYDSDDVDNVTLEIIYQDALYKTYIMKSNLKGEKRINQHLETFLKPPKRIWLPRFITYFKYKWKMWRVKKQGNTYPRLLEEKHKKLHEMFQQGFSNIEFIPVDNEGNERTEADDKQEESKEQNNTDNTEQGTH